MSASMNRAGRTPQPAADSTRDLALDIVSYGRRGPGGRLRFGAEQLAQIRRTVGRTSEVMVKVSGGGRDVGGVKAHLDYIDRHGKLSLETDEGLALEGRGAAQEIVEDWQLDLCRSHYKPKPDAKLSSLQDGSAARDTRPKLVHNIVLSMPRGTPPEKVLAGARIFARENFALQHRYAMVLHTDQPHPHVHLVVKCEHEFEPGRRLYIRKATLRQWREQFAALMREQGVAANATPRTVRGQVRRPYRDPIHHRLRALRDFEQGEDARSAKKPSPAKPTPPKTSTFMREKLEALLRTLKTAPQRLAEGRDTLQATRDEVTKDWSFTAEALRRQGEADLAAQVDRFTARMPPVQTDAERLAARWTQTRAKDRTPAPERDRSWDPPPHPPRNDPSR